MISPVTFKVLDTSFSTDHPGGAHFRSAHRPFCQPNSDRASAHIFCRGALVSVDWPWLTGNGKKRKSFVPGQLWHWRRCGYWSDPGRRNGLLPGYLGRADCDLLGANLVAKDGAPLVSRAVAKGCGERWMSLPVNLAWEEATA